MALPAGSVANGRLIIDDNFIDSILATNIAGAGPYTVTVNDAVASPCARIDAAGTGSMQLIQVRTPVSSAGHFKDATAVRDINTYCPGASSGGTTFDCLSGYDIVESFRGVPGVGSDRIIEFYEEDLFGIPAVLPRPIWVVKTDGDPKDQLPRLFIDEH